MYTTTIMDRSLTHKIITGFFLIVGLLLFIGTIFWLRSLLMLLFLAFIIASALNPTVTWLQKIKFPRPLSIALLYIIILSFIVVLLGLALPPLVRQTAQLLSTFSRILGVSDYTLEQITSLDFTTLANSADHYFKQYQSIIGQLQGSLNTVIDIIFSTFSAIFVFFTLLITTFYFLMNLDRIAVSFAWMLPGSHEEQANKARDIMKKVQHKLGGWVSGQVSLMILIGTVTYIGLTLLGIPFALPLALLAGLLEIIPNVGPTIAAIPSVLIAFFLVNPVMGIVTLIFAILVQQFENNLIVPYIMKGAVDVRPMTTLLLILVGFELIGVAGALLAIPFYITVRTFVQELWPNRGPFTDYSDYLPKRMRKNQA
jgi:predicted PurR-regulated permease PerM